MLKNLLLFTILITIFCVSAFSQNPEDKSVATVRFSLPEFRDVSIWKGRAGLTLFSPDGKYLAISGKTADVVIYETATGDIKTKIDGEGFVAFSFSPDSNLVVAQNIRDASLEIFETETGKQVRTIRGRSRVGNFYRILSGGITVAEMGKVPISPDWKNVLVAKNDKEFELFDFNTGEIRYEFEHQNFNTAWEVTKIFFVTTAAMYSSPFLLTTLSTTSQTQFSPDGKRVVIANGNKNPTLWNTETGNLISKFDSNKRIFSARFSPDGKLLSTSDINGITTIWDTETGNEVSNFGSKKDKTFVAMWSSDSEKVFSIGFSKKNDVRTFEARTGKNLFVLDKSDSYNLIPSDNSQFVATVPKKNKAILFQIWETLTGKLVATIPRKKGENSLFSLKWSPDNQLIAVTKGLKENITLWNLNGENVQTLANTTFPMKFSDDGKFLATGGKTNDPKNDVGFIWVIKK
jgi:WD40 repeat protein